MKRNYELSLKFWLQKVKKLDGGDRVDEISPLDSLAQPLIQTIDEERRKEEV